MAPVLNTSAAAKGAKAVLQAGRAQTKSARRCLQSAASATHTATLAQSRIAGFVASQIPTSRPTPVSPFAQQQGRALHASSLASYASMGAESVGSPAGYLATAPRYKDVRLPVDPEDPGVLIEDTIDKDTDLFRVGSGLLGERLGKATLQGRGPAELEFLTCSCPIFSLCRH